MKKYIIFFFSLIIVLILSVLFFQLQSTSIITGNAIEELKSLPYLAWIPVNKEDIAKIMGLTMGQISDIELHRDY